MSEPALKCENNFVISKQNYTQKLFISFKIYYSRISRFTPKIV